MRIEDDVKLDFDDVLIRPKRSTLQSRRDVELQRTYKFKHSGKPWIGIPIMASNMSTIGTFETAEIFSAHKMPTVLHKFYSVDDWKDRFSTKEIKMDLVIKYRYYIPSIGANPADLEYFVRLNKARFSTKYVCIDVANGYGEYFVDFVSRVRDLYPETTIIAGNVVTGEMTEQLLLSGADVVKVGIGSGSVCTTRLMTGVGYPQLTAIMECADAAHGLNGLIVADGGCRTPGDIAKAFGAGADFVMLGGMLAGHDETSTEFYGMSSKTAQTKYYGGQKEYRASEGKTVQVKSKGPIEETIQNILGGLRSTCTYVGAPSLKQLSKCTTFIRVSRTHNTVFGDSYD